jgi:hypothetical protein
MSLFEIGMLICFGVSWPVSIAKSLRTKNVSGKSPLFLFIIDLGYVFGILNKVVNRLENGNIHWVVWLYGINLGLVSFDLFLYYYYMYKTKKGTVA